MPIKYFTHRQILPPFHRVGMWSPNKNVNNAHHSNKRGLKENTKRVIMAENLIIKTEVMVSILHLHLGNDFKLHWNKILQFLAFYSSEGRCTHPPSKTDKSQITKIFFSALFLTPDLHSPLQQSHCSHTFTCTLSHWPSHSPVSLSKTGSIAPPEVGMEAWGCWWTSAPLLRFSTCSL